MYHDFRDCGEQIYHPVAFGSRVVPFFWFRDDDCKYAFKDCWEGVRSKEPVQYGCNYDWPSFV